MWRRVLLLVAILISGLNLAPYVVHVFHPAFSGLTVLRDKDYANYSSRLERALKGHPGEASNGISPVGSGDLGVQSAGMEILVAELFGWIPVDAPTLTVIVTAILAPLLFMLFVYWFWELGFTQWWALWLGAVPFIVNLHGFSRVMHPGWSFVPTILALIFFTRWCKNPNPLLGLVTGLLLGLLPSLYFWHWTWAWGIVGITIISLLLSKQKEWSTRFGLELLWLAVVTLAVAAPSIWELHSIRDNTIYPDVAIRASILYQRFPESWPRSALLLLQCIALWSLVKRYRSKISYWFIVSILTATFLVIHQNVTHGQVLMFASHYYPHLMIATLLAGGWMYLQRGSFWRRYGIMGITVLFLAAGVWDYSFAHRFFIPNDGDARDQHLLTPIALLQNADRDVVLTDAETGRVVTAWTDDGIVYTTHSRFLLISDAELAERYCVSEIPNPNPDPYRALYMEYNRVLSSPLMREKEATLVHEACSRVQADPRAYMQKYHVTKVLLNERVRPNWQVDEKKLGLGLRASGSGWMLWDVLPTL